MSKWVTTANRTNVIQNVTHLYILCVECFLLLNTHLNAHRIDSAHSLSTELTYSGLPSRRLRSRLYSAHLCAAVTFESISLSHVKRCRNTFSKPFVLPQFPLPRLQRPPIEQCFKFCGAKFRSRQFTGSPRISASKRGTISHTVRLRCGGSLSADYGYNPG